jgi:hypothetical protein
MLKSILLSAVFIGSLTTCSRLPIPAPNDLAVSISGFSGMAAINGTTFLSVHDEKSFETGNRISVIQTAQDKNVEIWPVHISDWKHEDGRSSDLEAVCRIPNRSEEFLLVESGHWDGKYGRMFHIRFDLSKKPYRARVLGVLDLPEFNGKGPNDKEGDEIEGVACATINDGAILVFLGERGGSSVYPSGLLRWVTADLNSHTLTWSALGKRGKIIKAPGVWKNASENRDIAALHLDSDNILWASATEDLGDSGPFYSVIFKIGLVNVWSSDPLQLSLPYSVSRSIDGFKIEALAHPSSAVSDSVFSVGTEDEVYGGAWRPLR